LACLEGLINFSKKDLKLESQKSFFSLIVLIILFLLANLLNAQIEYCDPPLEGCTIGVAAGVATSDGRPLVWKTRDSSSEDNEVIYNTSFPIKFLSVVTAGYSYSWMGVNEKGFAIINSMSADLPGSYNDNGRIMRDALGTCYTVDDFQHLLDSTNTPGGRRTQSNYAVIDSTGAAAIFETGDTIYWKYDALDINQATDGYILRTNFSMAGGGTAGIERYYRTVNLIADFYSGDTLNHKSILRTQMRDFSDYGSNPVPVPFPSSWIPGRPFGYIYTGISICRSASVSASVIHGVLQNESGKLSTMWTILGQPAGAIAVPYWPVGNTPGASNGNPTAPLCDVAKQIKSILYDYPDNTNYIDSYKLRDGTGGGLWTITFPAEDSVYVTTDSIMAQWNDTTPPIGEMLAFETSIADYALTVLQNAYVILAKPEITYSQPTGFQLFQNYPNPFNPTTTIEFSIPKTKFVTLKIYNILGQEVEELVSKQLTAGSYKYNWNAGHLASGVYSYKLEAGGYIQTHKLILMK